MKKLLTIISVVLCTVAAKAQKETDHWFFGTSAGIDFTGGTPVQETGAVFSMNEGSASISTPDGNLLFYTDGSQIWNANHTLMPNGTGLHGDVSSTQSAIIVPNPAAANQYYVFTTAPDGDTAGFKYSIVDMSLDGGLGDVTSTKNIPVLDSCTEKLCAIRTNTGNYWIMTHKWGSNEFYAYLLTGAGLQPPVISYTGTVHNTTMFQNTYGQMKFNSCGTKLALAIGYQDVIEVFDFDLNSGVVSNGFTIPQTDHVYGVEFSPNSELLYCTTYDITGTLLQYNISLSTLPLILASRTPLSVVPDIYGLQVASDKKIYAAKSFASSFVGVINSPDVQGPGCNYVENGVNIDTAFAGNTCGLGLPGFMQTYLKVAMEITCAPMGVEDNITGRMGIYPNPSSDIFYLDPDGFKDEVEITIIENTGRIIVRKVVNPAEYTFGEQLAPGIYFVNLRVGRDCKRMKIIKL